MFNMNSQFKLFASTITNAYADDNAFFIRHYAAGQFTLPRNNLLCPLNWGL